MSIIQKTMAKAVGAIARVWPDQPVDPMIDAHGVIGQPMSRVDGPLKVAGAARFVAEVPFERLAFASLVYSTIAKGSIVDIATDAAAGSAGVILVMTYRNAPKMAPPPLLALNSMGAAFSKLPVMQDARVHWNGEPVAVVLAETQEQAVFAASLVRVTYAPEPANLSFVAMLPTAKPLDNVLGQPSFVSKFGQGVDAHKGSDGEQELEQAAVRIDQIYRTPRYSHCAIEPHAVTAAWGVDGALTVHDPSQSLNAARYTYAEVFGVDEKTIRVVGPFVGGAFGNKFVWSHQLLCIAAAKLADRPVRMVLSREGVFRMTGGRTLTRQRVALGANEDGTLAVLIHTGTTAVVSHNACPEQFSFAARRMYAATALHIGQESVELDMVANSSMRAPGEAVGTFALESAMDELAERLSLDPIELRRRLEPATDPIDGREFGSRHMLEAYALGAERFGWAHRNPEPRSQRDGEWLVGQGVASAYYPYLRFPGGKARVRLTVDGRAVVQVAMHEMGMGTATVQVQHAAARLGLPVDRVTFEYGDTNLPPGTSGAGSAQTATTVAAVTAAHKILVADLLKLAGKGSVLHGAKPDEVRSRDGGLFLIEAPHLGETYVEILNRAGREFVEVEGSASLPFEMLKYSMHSYGAQFCEVRVNAITAETRVSRWVGSFDVGRVLNPKTAASQLRGAIIMGIGAALTEESLFDERTGRFMNPTLAEYHVPVHADVPEIDVIWTNIPDPHAPMGLHGVGEIGITGVAAAIANAIYNATGKRVRDLPITLDKLL